MAYKNNYVELINNKLMTRNESSNYEPFTLSTPDHQFKKRSVVFNQAIRDVYNERKNPDVKLFHILLSLNQYFELDWLMVNILDDDIKAQVKSEMSIEYNAESSRSYTPAPIIKSTLTLLNEAITEISVESISADKLKNDLEIDLKNLKKKIGLKKLELNPDLKLIGELENKMEKLSEQLSVNYPFPPFKSFNISAINETRCKTVAPIINEAIIRVYSNTDEYTEMNDIIVGLQDYFDPSWVVRAILDTENKEILENEMKSTYGVDINKMWNV